MLVVLCAVAGNAQTLTCSFQFIGSGTAGAQAFLNADIVISTAGFTDGVSGSVAAGTETLATQTTSIWISGVGMFQINEPAGISVQTSPADAAPGASVTQVIDLVISGQAVVSVTLATTSPWNLSGTYFGPPIFGEAPNGAFGFNPPDGQLQNWNLLPVLTTDGFTLNLYSTSGLMPMAFGAVLNPGALCAGIPIGNVSDVRSLIDQVLGIQPAAIDGNANVANVQSVIEGVLGCGTTGPTAATIGR